MLEVSLSKSNSSSMLQIRSDMLFLIMAMDSIISSISALPGAFELSFGADVADPDANAVVRA